MERTNEIIIHPHFEMIVISKKMYREGGKNRLRGRQHGIGPHQVQRFRCGNTWRMKRFTKIEVGETASETKPLSDAKKN